jgi:hypothetical protein
MSAIVTISGAVLKFLDIDRGYLRKMAAESACSRLMEQGTLVYFEAEQHPKSRLCDHPQTYRYNFRLGCACREHG